MKLDINNYPGSKTGSGVAEWIINHVPKHEETVEFFAGSGEITYQLILAGVTGNVVLIDKDANTVKQLAERFTKLMAQVKRAKIQIVDVRQCCAIELLHLMQDKPKPKGKLFVYFDPPYPFKVRRSQRPIYNHELTDVDHDIMLDHCLKLDGEGCFVMVSSYDNELYNERLKGWYTSEMTTMTNAGIAIEKIWMNYNIDDHLLATTKFIGKDFTDRQRIKRKITRYIKRLNKLPLHERQAVFESIQPIYNNLVEEIKTSIRTR